MRFACAHGEGVPRRAAESGEGGGAKGCDMDWSARGCGVKNVSWWARVVLKEILTGDVCCPPDL